MGATDPDCVPGDADATLDDCLAQLETLLPGASEPAGEGHSLLIPDSLFTAALQTPVSPHHTKRLLVILGDQERLHGILPRHSVYLIAYILLSSGDMDGQENGLRLLLYNFEYHRNDEKEPHERELPDEIYSSWIRAKLITTLYALFVEDRPGSSRRMVGKLLLDTITEASNYDALLLTPEECEIYCPRTASVFCYEKDLVLRFFAGAIIRILYLVGADEDVLWNSCNPEYRVKFLKCLKEFPENWALAFHWHETEHHGPRNSRTTPDGDEHSIKASGTSCRIINSVTIGPHIFEHDSTLVSATPESLIFILPVEEPTSGYFQFIDIPKGYILQPTQYDAANRHKHVVSLCLDAAGYFIMNGKTEQLGDSIIHIASDIDFTDLPLFKIGREPKPVVRRPSSMFITLDTADEIARKSNEHRKKPSQVGQESESLSESTGDNHGDIAIPGIACETSQRSQSIPEDAIENGYENACSLASAAEENVESPTRPDVSLHEDIAEPAQPDIPKQSSVNENIAPTSDPRPENPAGGMSPTSADPEPLGTPEETSNGSTKNSNQREGSGKSTTNERQPSRRKKRSTLPDTQESLVFHRPRRSNRNVYKGNPGPSVDWEEDLRPTPSQDEQLTGSEPQNDAEVTSISSPVPGDASIFAKSLDTMQRKKRRAPPSMSKEKPRAKRVSREARENIPRLPLQTTEANIDKTDIDTGGEKHLPYEIKEGEKNDNGAANGRNSEHHEPGAITTRAGKSSSPANRSPSSVRASEPNNQLIEDQSGLDVLDLTTGKGSERPSDPVLESHPMQDIGAEIGHEPTKINGILQKKTELKTSSVQGSESEQAHTPSSKNRRSESASEKQNKRLRFNVGYRLVSPGLRHGTKRASTDENGEKATKRMKVSSAEREPRASEMETDLDSEMSNSVQEQLTPSRRRYAIDETGSPRPISRYPDHDSRKKTDAKFKKTTYLCEDSSSPLGYDGESDDSSLSDSSLPYTSSIASPQNKHDCPPNNTSHPLSSLFASNAALKGRSAMRPERVVNTMVTPFSIPRSPHRADTSRIDKDREVNNGEKWQSCLKTVQKAMHDMLHETSKSFSSQLENERTAITRVLETYHQGCSQVLDQLFQAHEERIELYKQQIVSVRRQHRDLCQNLVRQIEDNDIRIAERIYTLSDLGSL